MAQNPELVIETTLLEKSPPKISTPAPTDGDKMKLELLKSLVRFSQLPQVLRALSSLSVEKAYVPTSGSASAGSSGEQAIVHPNNRPKNEISDRLAKSSA